MALKKQSLITLEFPENSAADLRGKQSVRTTFKLSERSIEALSILARQLGIKQKSLFDHLAEDTGALKVIAREFEHFSQRTQRVAKTYVISRKTLDNLEAISVRYNTPRDALVEYSIERILPLLELEKERHRKRKVIGNQMQDYLKRGLAILEKAEGELSPNDQVYQAVLAAVRAAQSASVSIDECVKKGDRLEEF
jgi:hypothetical protein